MSSSLRVDKAAPSLQHFESDGADLAYLDAGAGDPVLLIHGFGANALQNWVELGWADRLIAEGRRVVAIDNRGHGQSEKLYEPRAYSLPGLAEDARRLLDHLGIGRADILGYSMGARIAALLSVAHPHRVRSLVLGGMGRNLFAGLPPAHDLADDLEAARLDQAKTEDGRMFRAFAERTQGDLAALAACMRAAREPVDSEAFSRLSIPVLVAIGTRDTLAGPLAEMASCLPEAELFDIHGRSHMGAVADPTFMARVADFLAKRP
jgi:pimeloyl-ACP methyl ester carboxylesterase